MEPEENEPADEDGSAEDEEEREAIDEVVGDLLEIEEAADAVEVEEDVPDPTFAVEAGTPVGGAPLTESLPQTPLPPIVAPEDDALTSEQATQGTLPLPTPDADDDLAVGDRYLCPGCGRATLMPSVYRGVAYLSCHECLWQTTNVLELIPVKETDVLEYLAGEGWRKIALPTMYAGLLGAAYALLRWLRL